MFGGNDMEEKMHPEMLRELRYFMRGQDPRVDVDRVTMRGDYDTNGRYFGSCQRGERIHMVWGEYRHTYVRSRLTAPQLRKLCATLATPRTDR